MNQLFLLLLCYLLDSNIVFVLAHVLTVAVLRFFESFPSTEHQEQSLLSKPCIFPSDTNNTQEWPCSSSALLFFRFISTAVCVPSAEHCTCIPSCYANVSSGTSLHRHAPCIFWGNFTHMYKSWYCEPFHSRFKPLICVSADIPAQICASTSGAWSVASDVLSLPWCSGVHAHAATYVCWASGPECPHGLLPHGSSLPPWFNSDGGRWIWCWCSLHSRQQCFHPSEYPSGSMISRRRDYYKMLLTCSSSNVWVREYVRVVPDVWVCSSLL